MRRQSKRLSYLCLKYVGDGLGVGENVGGLICRRGAGSLAVALPRVTPALAAQRRPRDAI
jgi:hypothetical protein